MMNIETANLAQTVLPKLSSPAKRRYHLQSSRQEPT
jgi:hypothetical protein